MRPIQHYGSVWQRRTATTLAAVLIGLAALAFTAAADAAQKGFDYVVAHWPLLPLALTPAVYGLIAWLTRRFVPEARGSGIPQVMAATHHPVSAANARLVSLRTAAAKFVLTVLALGAGGSVGREGPTVQISAAIMEATHRAFRVPLTAAVTIAGGAAGVSAAFNTPLAGVAFAIEELASAYEQRLALLVMAAVLIAGLVSLGIAGDYYYFGAVHESLSLKAALIVSPVAGVLGGLSGGLFSRAMLAFTASGRRPIRVLKSHPVLWAAGAGLAIAVIGVAGAGLTWGTGYEVARRIIEGGSEPLWFGPAKFATTLLTALSGIPGGIFAPSLAVGTGLGQALAAIFPAEPVGAVVLLGMIAYFVGVVRAPLTAVLIVSEMTDGHKLILPLFATALIAEGVAALVSPERLYHGLSRGFREKPAQEAAQTAPP